MKKFNVEFSYNYQITAKDENEAEQLAKKQFDDDMPRTEEMNITVREE